MSISPGEDESADADLQQHGNKQDVRMWRSLRFRDVEFEACYVADVFASTRTESIVLLIFGTFMSIASIVIALSGKTSTPEAISATMLVVGLTFLISGKLLYGNRFGPQYKETAAVLAFIVGLAGMVAVFALHTGANPHVEDLQAAARVALNDAALDQTKEQPPWGVAANTYFVESVFFNEFYRADPQSVCQGIFDANTSSACASNGFAGGSCGVRAILCGQINYRDRRNRASGVFAVFMYIMVATALQSLRTRVVFAIPVNLVCSAVLAATVQEGYDVLLFMLLYIPSLYSREKQSRALFVLQSKQHRELRRKSISIKHIESKALMFAEKNAEMSMQLASAKKMVRQVMQEQQHTLKALEIPHADLAFSDELGQGAFGQVFKGVLRGSTDVAIKTMRVAKITNYVLSLFKKELVIMCALHHDSIVRLYGGVWNEGADKLCIVLEYCPLGSLNDFFGGESGESAEEGIGTWQSLRHGLALGIAKGLRYLHHELAEPLIHRDIKPDNVLMSSNHTPKIADFGSATHFDLKLAEEMADSNGNRALTMTMAGTRVYCAPEVISGDRYSECDIDETVDVFSFGLVLLCLAVGDIRYVAKEFSRLGAYGYTLRRRPVIPIELDKQGNPVLAQLIRSCWDHDVRARPSFKDVALRLETCTVLGESEEKVVLGAHQRCSEAVSDDVVLAAQESGLKMSHAEKDELIARLTTENDTLRAVAVSMKASDRGATLSSVVSPPTTME